MTSVGEVQTTEAFRVFLPSSSPVSPKKSPGVGVGLGLGLGLGVGVGDGWG